jgi:hypothetical protein
MGINISTGIERCCMELQSETLRKLGMDTLWLRMEKVPCPARLLRETT